MWVIFIWHKHVFKELLHEQKTFIAQYWLFQEQEQIQVWFNENYIKLKLTALNLSLFAYGT